MQDILIVVTSQPCLCPAQQKAYDWLRSAHGAGHVFVLTGAAGSGRTTVARALATEEGARFLNAWDLHQALHVAPSHQVEEAWTESLCKAVREEKRVVVDDFDGAAWLLGACHFYPRTNHFEIGMTAVCDEAERSAAWLLFVGNGRSSTLQDRALHCPIPKFTVGDQDFLFRAHFSPEATKGLDFEKVFRFAPRLNTRQIARASRFMNHPGLTTEELIEYLRSQDLLTNVDLGQVEAVDLRDLHGVDPVLEKLESHIILPLENDEISKRMNLTPRRGVLLYGPPGTGKTTVGRALAHRLKSKFFLIDGTCVSGTSDFYNSVFRIFEMAKRNAPAVVFIDDSDVIFEAGEEMGFYRYLLTILDGIESEEAGQLTILLTAMDIAHLPPALIRSGRVELWLEMKLPDAAARRRILEQRLARSVPGTPALDLDRIIEQTEGFTGADIRRLVEDAKNLWAYAIARGQGDEPTPFFLSAAREIAENKALLSKAEAHASAHFAGRRPARAGMNFEVFREMMRRAGEE